MVGVYALHYNPVVITSQIIGWRIERLLVDKGSGLSILFANCFERMEVWQNHIYVELVNVYGFGGQKSDLIEHVSLDVTLIGKVITIDFLLMGYKSPYTNILRKCLSTLGGV